MRQHFRTRARERIRNSRYDPFVTNAWFERLFEQSRTRRAWDSEGIAMPFVVVLHENAPLGLNIAETFRDAGFLVKAQGYAEIAVTGEPGIAIAFMLMAANAGLLCKRFLRFIDAYVNAQATLRTEDREHVLALAKTLGSIKSVCPVQHRAARKPKRSAALKAEATAR
jgi:hypothetical protein